MRFMCAILAVRCAGGRAHHREVVDDDRDVAPVDLAEAGDLAVGLRFVRLLRIDTGGTEQPGFDERILVEEPLNPLTRIEHACGITFRILVRAAACERLGAPGFIFGEQCFE